MAGVKPTPIARRRHRTSPAERAQWIERYYESGLSPCDFAIQQGLRASSLQRWLRQAPKRGAAPVFAELKLPSISPRWAAELVHSDGTVLRLAADVPITLVDYLLAPC
jgi:transposase-like protein